MLGGLVLGVSLAVGVGDGLVDAGADGEAQRLGQDGGGGGESLGVFGAGGEQGGPAGGVDGLGAVWWTSAGVCSPIPAWWWSWLYQAAKVFMCARAWAREAKRSGKVGAYLTVLNSASL